MAFSPNAFLPLSGMANNNAPRTIPHFNLLTLMPLGWVLAILTVR